MALTSRKIIQIDSHPTFYIEHVKDYIRMYLREYYGLYQAVLYFQQGKWGPSSYVEHIFFWLGYQNFKTETIIFGLHFFLNFTLCTCVQIDWVVWAGQMLTPNCHHGKSSFPRWTPLQSWACLGAVKCFSGGPGSSVQLAQRLTGSVTFGHFLLFLFIMTRCFLCSAGDILIWEFDLNTLS